MAKTKNNVDGKVSNGEGRDWKLTKRQDEIVALLEAIEAASEMLYAADGAVIEERMSLEAAGEVMQGSKALLDAALEAFNRLKIKTMNLYELNAACPEAYPTRVTPVVGPVQYKPSIETR